MTRRTHHHATLPADTSRSNRCSTHGTPDGGDDRFQKGWWTTKAASLPVVSAAGSDVWYPRMGIRSTGTYTISVTVPDEYNVVANGRLAQLTSCRRGRRAGRRPIPTPENDEPTASYMVTFPTQGCSDSENAGGPRRHHADRLPFPPICPGGNARIFSTSPRRCWMHSASDLARTRWSHLGDRAGRHPVRRRAGNPDRSPTTSSAREQTVAYEIARLVVREQRVPGAMAGYLAQRGIRAYAQVLWDEARVRRGQGAATLPPPDLIFANDCTQRWQQGSRSAIPAQEQHLSRGGVRGRRRLPEQLRAETGTRRFLDLLQEWNALPTGNANSGDFRALARRSLARIWTPSLRTGSIHTGRRSAWQIPSPAPCSEFTPPP